MQDDRENKKLAAVKEMLLAKINELGTGLAAKKAGVLETRKEMWREARIVLRDFDDVADLTIFAEEVARHEVQYVQASLELKKLGKMMDCPYFARIDFREDGDNKTEEIYIGRHSLFDENSKAFFVYDWRAPISGLYYDYGVGTAEFTVPATGAVIGGAVSLKRQYQIEKGQLLYMFDNDLNIEDDILRRELSKASDAHIKTIINTIQAEQNRAIRSEAGDILVYGPAGSGKTSVGLHRLAYLLYRHRGSLTSSKVRIFSPSAIFASYIEGIIPELGEEDVKTLSFPELLSGLRQKFHSPYQQIEHICNSPDDFRTKWLAIKYSANFLDGLEKAITGYAPTFEDVVFYKDKVCDAGRLEALYQDRTTSGTLASKTERVLFFVNQAYMEYYKENLKNITKLFNDIHDDNFSDFEIQSKFEEEKNIVITDLRNRMLPKAARLFEKYLRSQAKAHGLPFTPAKDSLRMDLLFYEDALLLSYVDLLTGRVAGDKSVKHILLDEAQDLSVLHHRILRRLYPASRFTVLADVNQALYPEINITNNEALFALYPKAEVIPLTKSYRSTYEIMSFAAKALGQSEPNAFLRHGEIPSISSSEDPAATAMDILQQLPGEYNTVGILLPTIREARAFYEKLSKIYKENTPRPLRLIAGESLGFEPGVMIIAAPLAKGLEFDVVINPQDGQRGIHEKLLYLIYTRALHRLYIIQDFTNPRP